MSNFDESKHPRDGKGKFSSTDGVGGTHEATPAESKRLEELGITQTRLSKQEWAKFYERIGKIKKEGHYIPKTTKGEMIIPIETEDSYVLVIANGTYQTPKVNFAVRFENNNDMYDTIERLEDYE